jgi:hypothetical protein
MEQARVVILAGRVTPARAVVMVVEETLKVPLAISANPVRVPRNGLRASTGISPRSK